MSRLTDAVILKLYPELRAADDVRVRRQAWRWAARRCRRSPLLMAWIAVFGGGMVVGWLVVRDFTFPAWWPPLLHVLLALYTLWIILTVFYPFIARQRMRRALREALAQAGVPICVRCGYDLRGQCNAVCPECGQVSGCQV